MLKSKGPSTFKAKARIIRTGKCVNGCQHDHQRGAAVVEFALVAPVFVILLLGLIEMGLASLDFLTLANASRTGARTASAAQANSDADLITLQAIKSSIAVINTNKIDRIVIFNATTVKDPSDDCKNGTSSALKGFECNSYTPSTDFPNIDDSATDAQKAQYICDDDTVVNRASSWCAKDRNVTIPATPTDPPLDDIGIWIQVDHKWISGFFGDEVFLHSNTIMRLEPAFKS